MSLDIRLSMMVDAGGAEPFRAVMYEDVITSNVWPMWQQADCAEVLHWGGIAAVLLPTLTEAAAAMEADPATYKKLIRTNGWGNYDGALAFLQNLIAACLRFPKATVDSY